MGMNGQPPGFDLGQQGGQVFPIHHIEEDQGLSHLLLLSELAALLNDGVRRGRIEQAWTPEDVRTVLGTSAPVTP